MRIAITGGAGFVGQHLSARLLDSRHEVVLMVRRLRNDIPGHGPAESYAVSDLSDTSSLIGAMQGCDAIAHCAGINREVGRQTYQRVHVDGTTNLLKAAKIAGVKKIALVSFLRARPNCGSAYHESKWAAEELVRNSGLDYTILKCGIIYGKGDHMLSHLQSALLRFPLFATVGLREKPMSPVPVQELVEILYAALVRDHLSRNTVAVVGAEELCLSEIVTRIASVVGRSVLLMPAPVSFHYALARIFEGTMQVPLLSSAQVRILAEGVTEAAPACETLPPDLKPLLKFTVEQIRAGLPDNNIGGSEGRT